MDLHPVDDHTCTATWDPTASLLDDPTPVAGEGTPLVAERAVEELGAALDVSYRSALALVTDALELRHRLPRLWALVQAGRLQAWKARRVAEQTTHLSREAVAFVDRQAAIAGAKNRIVANLTGLVHEALVRFDPDPARRREDADLSHREVVFDFRGDTARLRQPHRHPRPGRRPRPRRHGLRPRHRRWAASATSHPLGTRRAHALGMLARPQQALDLFGEPEQETAGGS